jgi:hypothetical protein
MALQMQRHEENSQKFAFEVSRSCAKTVEMDRIGSGCLKHIILFLNSEDLLMSALYVNKEWNAISVPHFWEFLQIEIDEEFVTAVSIGELEFREPKAQEIVVREQKNFCFVEDLMINGDIMNSQIAKMLNSETFSRVKKLCLALENGEFKVQFVDVLNRLDRLKLTKIVVDLTRMVFETQNDLDIMFETIASCPNLNDLVIVNCMDDDKEFEPWLEKERTDFSLSNLRRLVLENCNASICSSLKRFAGELLELRLENIPAENLISLIGEAKRTLNSLAINLSSFDEKYADELAIQIVSCANLRILKLFKSDGQNDSKLLIRLEKELFGLDVFQFGGISPELAFPFGLVCCARDIRIRLHSSNQPELLKMISSISRQENNIDFVKSIQIIHPQYHWDDLTPFFSEANFHPNAVRDEEMAKLLNPIFPNLTKCAYLRPEFEE